MRPFSPSHLRFTTTLLITALFVSGCSSSSDSSTSTNALDDGSAESLIVAASNGSPLIDEASTFETGSSGSESNSVESIPNSQKPDPVVENQLAQNTTLVNFDITVPVYVSDALQVRLVWGDQNITASWVADESWAISTDFPMNTENQLFVTFNDENGAITLGSFEAAFKTGMSASESFQIRANQFNTNQWDSDGDGVSNLAEPITGKNPLVADVLPETEIGSIGILEDIALIFDIVDGHAVDVMSSAAYALDLSIDESAYPLLSTAPYETSNSLRIYNDTHTFNCPVSGTVSRTTYTQEGYGFGTLLQADNCADLDQLMDGHYQTGKRWDRIGEAFSSSSNVTITLNDGAYHLEAEQLHQQLDLEGEGPFPEAYYSGTNISVAAHGVPVYSVGSLVVQEAKGLNSLVTFRSTVSNIVTSGIDIDEIGGLNLSRVGGAFFSKSEASEYFTKGTLVGSKDGIEVLLVSADTGDEATFSVIRTSGGSTISELVSWTEKIQFGNYPLPD